MGKNLFLTGVIFQTSEIAKHSKSILIDLTVKVLYEDYFYIFLHS